MRTFRELLGWALWPVVPLVLLAGLAFSSRDGDPRPFLLSLGVALAWPGLARLSRRLRDPLPEEIAEADGRRPVALLHGFTRSRVPLWRRLFVFQPQFWRDRADARLERALGESLGAAGPVVPLARPATARSGPVATLDDSKWRAALERRIKHARMVAVALDESAECVDEVLRAAAVVGLRKLVLIPPMRRTPAFLERFAALRVQLPQLPALPSDTLAIRFSLDGQPLLMSGSAMSRSLSLLGAPAMMLFDGEARPAPKPPGASWFLTLAALGSAVVACVAGPLLLSSAGRPMHGDAPIVAGTAVLALGVMMAVLSRRAVRLVPSSELPIVLVAASPWMFLELAGLSTGLDARLEASMIGAAYSYALLLGAGFVLAGGALIRSAPNRRIAFGFFGLVAAVPIATLLVALLAHDDRALVSGFALAPAAVVFALALIASSGDAGRAHAPLPLGAAVAAALAIAAAMSLPTSAIWRGASRAASLSQVNALTAAVSATYDMDRALIWFVCALPALAVLVASLHSRRVSRVSIGNALTLVPLALLLCSLAATHTEARTAFSRLYRASGAADLHGFALPPEGFDPMVFGDHGSVQTGQLTGILGSDTLSLRGSAPLPLTSLGTQNQAAQRALRRAPVTGPLRLLVSRYCGSESLRAVLEWARAMGAPGVELVGVHDLQRRSVLVGLDVGWAPDRWEDLLLFVQLERRATIISASDGMFIEIPRDDSEDAVLRDRLADRADREPSRRMAYVTFDYGVELSRLIRTVEIVGEQFPDVRYRPAR